MLKNYVAIALRAFLKHKVLSTINILGLSIGLASVILIFLYIHSELNFDSVFPDKENTYRLGLKFTDAQGNTNFSSTMPGGWGKRMVNDLEEVTDQTKFIWFGMPTSLQQKDEDRILLTEDVAWVEENIRNVLYFPLLKGNPEKVFDGPNTLVVSETASKELFGDEDPINKQVILKHPYATNNEELLLTVTGVVEDYPENTHFYAKYFINYKALKPYFQLGPNTTFEQFEESMVNGFFALYLRTTGNVNEAKIQNYIDNLTDEVINENPQIREQLAGGKVDVFMRNVGDIHFDNEVQWVNEGSGNIRYIYIFTGVAFLIIIVACINYMNLSTARSGKRSKEIGLRKSLGSLRKQLFMQFMVESFVMVLIAFLLALFLAIGLLPVFNAIAEKRILISDLLNGQLAIALLVLWIIVAFISGIYPALFLSGFNTIEVLKGKFTFSKGSQFFRKFLTTFQFGISLFLLTATIVVVRQMDLMQSSALNTSGDQILSIRHGGTAEYNRYASFKNLVQQDPDLQQVTFCNHLPRLDYFGPLQTPFKFPEINQEEYSWNTFNVDYDFPTTFNLELIAGRFFEKGNVADSTSLILNETAVKALGKAPEEIIGTSMTAPHVNGYFDYNYDRLRTGTVIGVVKDFTYMSAYQAIEPLVIDPTPHVMDRILYIKLPAGKIQEKIAYIENQWKKVYPGIGLDYWFVNDEFGRMYTAERRVTALSKNFSGLAIIITCIGLFGLSSFVAEQRTKEIGVRKAMGASNAQILLLLLSTFIRLLLIACVLAIPLSYFASDKLLQTFVYRTPLDPFIFVIGVCIIAGLTLLTVGYESLKASLVNPVKSLRYE